MARTTAAAVSDNLILIGMTGAGKSAVGRAAAQALGLRFADVDDEISASARKSIPDIFAQDGEDAFRGMETRALGEILSADGMVVATGGGAALRAENRALMRKRGAIVHLDASPDLLRARLGAREIAARPLLQNGESIESMRRSRTPLYRRIADFSVAAAARETPDQTAGRMLRVIRESPAVIRVPLSGGRDYPVVVGRGLLGDVKSWIGDAPQTVVVASSAVFKRHGARAAEGLKELPGGFVLLPDGEENKSMETLGAVLDQFAKAKLGRDGVVMALGGGVAGDVGGFAAAVYMRGVRLLQAPTTLLAMVDAAIGGKTGVNHPEGKNLIGAFHQPIAVLCDLDTLRTLPEAETRSGLAEVVKYGMLGDAAFFRWLEKNAGDVAALDAAAIRRAVVHSARAKAAIVAADERESDSRALLNLGHTFAHAIESATGYGEWRHGEAVSAGLVAAAELSARVLDFPQSDVARVRNLLAKLNLPTALPAGMSSGLREAMRMDKKSRAGRERFVLMRALGDAVAGRAVSESALQAALKAASE